MDDVMPPESPELIRLQDELRKLNWERRTKYRDKGLPTPPEMLERGKQLWESIMQLERSKQRR